MRIKGYIVRDLHFGLDLFLLFIFNTTQAQFILIFRDQKY